VLYRVDPDFRTPGAQSGTALCVAEELLDGTAVSTVAGFQAFVQQVSSGQRYHMEGEQLYSMLQEGSVAFYGAFQVPMKLRDEHTIV